MHPFLALVKRLMFFAGRVSGNSSFPDPLTSEQERACIKSYMESGDEDARLTLIEHNLRLVAHIAKKYSVNGQDNDDLISIGTIGLIKAIATYNINKGAQLATYAARCIENEILMTIRSSKKLACEISINEPIGVDKDGNAISLMDILGSLHALVPDEVEIRIASQQLKSAIEELLTPREKTVVRLRYGLDAQQPLPQREIAKRLGISRSYVSRIEKKALQKLSKSICE